MASELRVNSLKDASGNNSVATSTVAQGSAKVHCLWDMADLSGTGGTTGIDTSFNVSSMDDDGTGDFGINFTSSFSSVNYVAPSATKAGARRVLTRTFATASSMDGLTRNDSNSNSDAAGCSVTIHGDLA